MPQLFRNLFIVYPRAIIRIAIVILNNLYCIPTYVIWMTLLLPIKRCHPDLYYKVEGLFFHWLLSVVAMWSWTAGYDIVELGDDISPCQSKDSRTLIIANHQSTADVPLLMACFSAKPDILPNIMWIMDRVFKFTNFGIVSVIHQDFFVRAGKKTRDATVARLRDHIRESFIPRERNWMVLFPEGGFLRKRREVSQRYAEKNNFPVLKNVSLPRIGAMKAIMEVLPARSNLGNNNASSKRYENGNLRTISNEDQTLQYQNKKDGGFETYLDYVLDVTIAYPEGKPLDLPSIVTGIRPPCQTYLLYRLYHSSEIPKEEDALTKWLFDRWTEKEAILENYYTTGSFTYPAAIPPTIVEQDMLRFLIINLFFMTSTYVHYKLFYIMYEYCNSYL